MTANTHNTRVTDITKSVTCLQRQSSIILSCRVYMYVKSANR